MKTTCFNLRASRVGFVAALAVAILLSLSTFSNAETITLTGFQGTFGDVEANGSLDAVEGVTSGETVGAGLTATLTDQMIDLTGWMADGDPVSISNLVLTGSNGVSGSVTYKWTGAKLKQLATPADFGGYPIGMGGIVGDLAIVGQNTLTTSGGDTFVLPETISATFTYNGAYVDMSSGSPVPVNLNFASASITATATSQPVIPEPSTVILGLFGVLGLVAARRRR